jgi:predicted RNase H-like HicB family nuclease
MPRYVALIHKDPDGFYSVSFPDLPGVITGGDTVDEALEEASEVLQFAAENLINPDGSTGLKAPSTIEELRKNPEFLEDSKDAEIAFVDYPADADAAE